MIYGIDIGGTKIELVAFDDDMESTHRERAATPTDDYDAFIDAIAGLVERADERFGTAGRVGLGIPGLIDRAHRSFSSNVPCINGRTIAPDVADRLHRAVIAENDCRCFALSEATGGAGADCRVVLGAILGTGAASGLVSQGVLLKGRYSIAGEYGHVPLPASLQQAYRLPILQCACGLPACVECYISGPGMLRLAAFFGATASTPQALAEAWRAGDPSALRVRDCFFDILGSTFATMVKLYDPDVIVMGGGLSLIDEVVTMLPDAMTAHLFPGFSSPPVVAAKYGDSSGVRGAALLVRDHLRAMAAA